MVETQKTFKCKKVELKIVSEYKYLGIWLNYCLDLQQIVDVLSSAGSRTLGSMISKTRSNYDLGYNSFTTLFNTTVVPVLDYAVGARYNGSPNVCKKLDQIQYRAARFFCGVPKSCPLAGLMGDLGWVPGVVRRDLENLHLYNQICKMTDDRLTKQVFLNDWGNVKNGSWAKNVLQICRSINHENSWLELRPV